MKNRFLFGILALALIFTYMTANAQELVSPLKSGIHHTRMVEADVLYDQTAGTYGYTKAAQDFEDAYPQYDCYAADDFVVPASGWSIEEIVLYGGYWNGSFSNTFNFYIFTDNAGIPGTEVAAFENVTANVTEYSAGFIEIDYTLGSPYNLPAGNYFLVFQCRWDFGTVGQGGPTPTDFDGATTPGVVWLWMNPGDGFGTGCTNWTSALAVPGWTDLEEVVPFAILGTMGGIPVELTSFAGTSVNNSVELNWATATETNNSHFVVERKTETGTFAEIGRVTGSGTTTEAHTYSFFDKNLAAGTYTYRLRQVDFSGAFELSSEVNVTINVPVEFALEQNFPNPFNPSTTINFSLVNDAKVTLKVFNTVGEEVATIVNSTLSAGSHVVTFDASNLTSGIYMYRLDASGIDGTNFSSIKKMVLMK